MTDYWDYYDETFDWDDSRELVRPDLAQTRKLFESMGLSEAEAEAHISSGYLVRMDDTIVDRYYGGALRRIDMRTRIPASRFLSARQAAANRVPVRNAFSMADLLRKVEEFQKTSSPLVYRGQTRCHPLRREIPNPFLEFEGLGEISLLPSLWRAMQRKKPTSFCGFQTLTLLEWSKIIYSRFDLAEIERRQDAINADGG